MRSNTDDNAEYETRMVALHHGRSFAARKLPVLPGGRWVAGRVARIYGLALLAKEPAVVLAGRIFAQAWILQRARLRASVLTALPYAALAAFPDSPGVNEQIAETEG